MSINKLFYSTKSEERLKAAKEPGLVEGLAGFDIINFIMQEPVPEVIYEVCKNNKVNIVGSTRLCFLRKRRGVARLGLDRTKAFIEGSLKQPTEINSVWYFLDIQVHGARQNPWYIRSCLPIPTLLSTTAEYLKTLDDDTALTGCVREAILHVLLCLTKSDGPPVDVHCFTKEEGKDIVSILGYINSSELLDDQERASVLSKTSKVMLNTSTCLTDEGVALVKARPHLLYQLVDKQLSIIQAIPEHASWKVCAEVGNLHYLLVNCITNHTNMDKLINANKVLDYYKNEMYDEVLKGTVDVCAETKFVRIDRVGV